MERSNRCPHSVRICLVFFFLFILCRIDVAHAFTLGKTYDSKNWQEIEDIAPPFLVNWVKNAEFILATRALNFDFELEKAFLEASKENLDKFDINDDGFIVDKEARRPPEFVYGLPFPQIDAQVPDAGERVMANFLYVRMRSGGQITPNENSLIGKRGLERIIATVYKRLYYQGHPEGPIKNNDNFLQQGMLNVVEPMSLKDVVRIWWIYNDHRQDTTFAYVAALRRFKRTASTGRSEPQLGSDVSKDDDYLWNGKNSTFNWRLVGEKNVLCAFTSPNKIILDDMSGGTFKRVSSQMKLGYGEPSWKGTPWAPLNFTWSPRSVWIVEGFAKDPEYNYGKQLFYVDKDTFTIWFKEIYDRSGQFWKGILGIQSLQIAPDGRTNVSYLDAYLAIDDQTKHATYYRDIASRGGAENVLYCPIPMLGPKDFNLNIAQQLSK